MLDEVNRELLCKDCVHSRASWFSRLTRTSYGFKCHHPLSWIKEEFSPVTGVTTPGYWSNCSGMRISSSKCGPEAKNWSPRNTKKHLFLQIKHGR